MRLVTWNVNGLKAAERRCGNLQRLLHSIDADIICLQETKVKNGDLERELALVEGWHSFFSCSRGSTGYSGVATFCRCSSTVPIAASEGLTGFLQPEGLGGCSDPLLEEHFSLERLRELDSEGRAVITDHGAFVLFNLYGPAITNEETAEERMAFKLHFYKVLELRVRQLLASGRQVLVVGDLNISPQPLDNCCPSDTFSSRPDRVWLNSLLQAGAGPFVDVFRCFHPQREAAFTCWSTATGARINNYGSRIDLILAAGSSIAAAGGSGSGWFQNCDISVDFQGSDHAPVWVDITPAAAVTCGIDPPPLCTAYMFKGKQSSLRAWLSAASAAPQAAAPAVLQPAGAVGPAAGKIQKPPSSGVTGKGAPAGSRQGKGTKRARAAGQTSLLSFLSKSAKARGPERIEGSSGSSAGAVPCTTTSLVDNFTGQQPGSEASGADAASTPEWRVEQAGGQPAGVVGDSSAMASSGGCSSQHAMGCGHGGHPCEHAPRTAAVTTDDPSAAPSHPACMPTLAAVQASSTAPDSAAEQAPSSAATATGDEQLAGWDQQRWQSGAGTSCSAGASGTLPSSALAGAVGSAEDPASAWRRISESMKPPSCTGHKEPCVIRTVKKKGANAGRQFYVCARPDGPPPVGRCNFFEWASRRGPKKPAG